MNKKSMTIEEMEKRWPKLPPFDATRILFVDETRARDSFGIDINQETIKEIREYLDAVEECLNG